MDHSINSASSYGANPKVLVVDDEPHIRDLILMILSLNGFPAESVVDGKAAFDLITENPQALPALVLLDVMMPRMTGPELIDALKEQGILNQLTIVVVTASDRSTHAGLLERGASQVISKDALVSDIPSIAKQALAPVHP